MRGQREIHHGQPGLTGERRRGTVTPAVAVVAAAAALACTYDACRLVDARHALRVEEVREIRFAHHLPGDVAPSVWVAVRADRAGQEPVEAVETVLPAPGECGGPQTGYMQLRWGEFATLVGHLNRARIWRLADPRAESCPAGHWHVYVRLDPAAAARGPVEMRTIMAAGAASGLGGSARAELSEQFEGYTPHCPHE